MTLCENISAGYLAELFNGDQFHQRALRIADFSSRTGREGAFASYKIVGEDQTVHFPYDTWFCEGEEMTIHIDIRTAYFNPDEKPLIYIAVGTHSHPEYDAMLSPADLNNLALFRKDARDILQADVKPIGAIVCPLVGYQDNALILFQEKTTEPVSEDKSREVASDVIARCREYGNHERLMWLDSSGQLMPYSYYGKSYMSFPLDKSFEEIGLYNSLVIGFSAGHLKIPASFLKKFEFSTG